MKTTDQVVQELGLAEAAKVLFRNYQLPKDFPEQTVRGWMEIFSEAERSGHDSLQDTIIYRLQEREDITLDDIKEMATFGHPQLNATVVTRYLMHGDISWEQVKELLSGLTRLADDRGILRPTLLNRGIKLAGEDFDRLEWLHKFSLNNGRSRLGEIVSKMLPLADNTQRRVILYPHVDPEAQLQIVMAIRESQPTHAEWCSIFHSTGIENTALGAIAHASILLTANTEEDFQRIASWTASRGDGSQEYAALARLPLARSSFEGLNGLLTDAKAVPSRVGRLLTTAILSEMKSRADSLSELAIVYQRGGKEAASDEALLSRIKEKVADMTTEDLEQYSATQDLRGQIEIIVQTELLKRKNLTLDQLIEKYRMLNISAEGAELRKVITEMISNLDLRPSVWLDVAFSLERMDNLHSVIFAQAVKSASSTEDLLKLKAGTSDGKIHALITERLRQVIESIPQEA